MYKRLFYFLIIFSFIFITAKIPDIPDKYIIFQKANDGYDLYIKKIEGIESILLTESQKDPQLKKTNYGLRTEKFYPCNGNELRILDGKILQTKYDLFSLVDSTPEPHPILGEAFHFFLPETVIYGYPWTREGKIEIKPGVIINLRLFEKKYADYSGEFKDQWIELKLYYEETDYNKGVIENLKEITTKKEIIISKNENIKDALLNNIIENIPVEYDLDVVFIIDTTLSMKEEMPIFKKNFPELFQTILKKCKYPRIAFIFYRDYGDIFLTRVYDFTIEQKQIEYIVQNIQIDGGGDIPEALYEAIVELKKLSFKSENRIAFLIADAPAHPYPRGKITKEDAINCLKELNIKLISICLPVK